MSVSTAPHTDPSLTSASAVLYAPLMNSFADVSWPINRASLAALSDAGLSVEQIARYFSLDAAEVGGLLNPSDLTGRASLVR
jgi:hypothetical protein